MLKLQASLQLLALLQGSPHFSEIIFSVAGMNDIKIVLCIQYISWWCGIGLLLNKLLIVESLCIELISSMLQQIANKYLVHLLLTTVTYQVVLLSLSNA